MYRMYGISQGAMDGGAMNVQGVRYIARSHGRRCDECTGRTVYRGAMDGKEQRMLLER